MCTSHGSAVGHPNRASSDGDHRGSQGAHTSILIFREPHRKSVSNPKRTAPSIPPAYWWMYASNCEMVISCSWMMSFTMSRIDNMPRTVLPSTTGR
jgi:hypothetical protein